MHAVLSRAVALLLAVQGAAARTINLEEAGAVPNDRSLATKWANGAVLNATLANLSAGDRLLIPNSTYYIMGGIQSRGLKSVVIQIDGTLSFADDISEWPRSGNGRTAKVLNCIQLYDAVNLTITSSGRGTLDGNGATWWGFPGIGYLVRAENRPMLMKLSNCKQTLIERVLFLNSPYWTFDADSGTDGLEIRYSEISARRTRVDKHDLIDMTAFNTDGFDVGGNNVYIHDCKIWNQDDCIAVKGTSSNMLFERIEASGVGFTIGSVGRDEISNITFRDSTMHHTYKGIYLKFNSGADQSPGGHVYNVLYENIVIDQPSQWPIWIGPAQQSDSRNLCAAHPCSICWPTLPTAACNAPAYGLYENITLRNVTVLNPKMSPGVLLGSSESPMKNIRFEDVTVVNPGSKPWKDEFYKCDGIATGVATGTTWPVPPCFEDRTDKQQ